MSHHRTLAGAHAMRGNLERMGMEGPAMCLDMLGVMGIIG